ncbi:MAG: Uma2 family endonuclease [Gemmataceae bacterium]|nr:Uma2 family endonuclease [Gemmataceae bacterium]
MRWTCADFHRVGDSGAFEGKRPLLLDGVIFQHGPMSPLHAISMELVGDSLRQAFGSEWWPRNQMPLVLSHDTDPVPDFAVVSKSPRYHDVHPTTAGLVVEVADTSLDFDMNFKRLLYAKAGIPEYWVVDVNDRMLWVYRDPQAGDYRSRQSFGAAAKVQPLSSQTAITVADLLR